MDIGTKEYQLGDSRTIDAEVTPEGSLELLSQLEVNQLLDTSQGGLYELYRRCSLAVLNCGSQIDDSKLIMEQFRPLPMPKRAT